MRIKQSANNGILFYIFYRYFYKPKKGTLAELLSNYSRSLPHQLTVIQVGANDGITHDPVHKFIKRDGWKGILLEPQKNVFSTLAYVYHKNKDIITLNAALDKQDGGRAIYKIGFSEARWASGLTSFDKTTIEKAFTSGYVATKAAEEGLIIPKEERDRIKTELVTLISPKTLLEKYNIHQIDLLQIDTEGYDFEIIKMFDLTQIKPELIVFESKHLSDEDKVTCFECLKSYDYQLKTFGANTVALQNSNTLTQLLM